MNNQPISKPEFRKDGAVLVHTIFHTIQGEGIFSGEPATFVRLSGCNLRCPGCDTEYTDGAKLMSAELITARVEGMHTSPNKLVVISGGEPLRQELYALVSLLISKGYKVQIETNGTLGLTPNMRHLCSMFLGKSLFIMCSPKGRINRDIAAYVSAYKYVLHYCHVNPSNGLPSRVLELKAKMGYPEFDNVKIFLQPMDCKDGVVNAKNLEAVKTSCMQHGYTLCLQVHKLINVE